MRVFVAGATGVLGRPTVERLVAAGHDVRGSARGEAKAELLRSLGATPATVDLFDAASVREAVGDAEAVLHLATKIPPLMKMRSAKAWEENNRLRREATKHLVDAALAAKAQVYVQESITFIYSDGGDEWVGEDAPINVSWPAALESTLDMEREAGRFGESGGGGAVILRFGLFYAPYAASTQDAAKMMKRRMFGVIGKGDNYFSNIHVDDAAAAVVDALDAPGGTYNVVEDEPTRQIEYARAFSGAMQLPKPMRFPAWLGKLIMGGPASYILKSVRASNRRFKDATGWSPRYPSVREGFAQVAEEMGKAK